jgi:diguanylate cyclase (GGDEF)-like protein
LAEKLRRAIGSALLLSKHKITASLGVATLCPEDDLSALIRRADLALYRAKERGRNRVEANFSNAD